MKKTIENKILKAQALAVRAQAIGYVYELLEKTYRDAFMIMACDENGNWLTDENGEYIYRERKDDETYSYPWYDSEKFKAARAIFEEIMSKVEKMD